MDSALTQRPDKNGVFTGLAARLEARLELALGGVHYQHGHVGGGGTWRSHRSHRGHTRRTGVTRRTYESYGRQADGRTDGSDRVSRVRQGQTGQTGQMGPDGPDGAGDVNGRLSTNVDKARLSANVQRGH